MENNETSRGHACKWVSTYGPRGYSKAYDICSQRLNRADFKYIDYFK